MSEQNVEEDIAHNHALITSYTKTLRVLEVQAAKFGMFVPPYMQIEIDTVKADRQRCIDTIARLQGTFAADPAPPSAAASVPPAMLDRPTHPRLVPLRSRRAVILVSLLALLVVVVLVV